MSKFRKGDIIKRKLTGTFSVGENLIARANSIYVVEDLDAGRYSLINVDGTYGTLYCRNTDIVFTKVGHIETAKVLEFIKSFANE